MTEILLALFVVLGTAGQTPLALQESEIAAAIAAGDRGEGLLPFVLGYGGAADPYVIALAYPPEVRLALASNAAMVVRTAWSTEWAVPLPLVEVAEAVRWSMKTSGAAGVCRSRRIVAAGRGACFWSLTRCGRLCLYRSVP